MKRKPDNTQLENRGINVTSEIVKSLAGHDWQEFEQRNDDGVDGIILFRKNTEKTGEIFFVQVKCGQKSGGYFQEYKKRPYHFGVNLTEKYINSHKPRWNSVPGPMILIFVDYDSSKAWWVDLKNEDSFTHENKQIVLVPKSQRFGIHSFGEFRKLKGYTFIDPSLEEIDIDISDTNYLSITANESIKHQAKRFYTNWSTSIAGQRWNPVLGEITVSRIGWRHLTRRKRRKSRIFQSFQLLGIAKKIIQRTTKFWQVKVHENKTLSDGSILITDFIGLRRKVMFSYRGATVVQVLLKRKRIINPTTKKIYSKVWFYSVYEPFVTRGI